MDLPQDDYEGGESESKPLLGPIPIQDSAALRKVTSEIGAKLDQRELSQIKTRLSKLEEEFREA